MNMSMYRGQCRPVYQRLARHLYLRPQMLQMVGAEGFEPSSIAGEDFKSSVYANSTMLPHTCVLILSP